MENDQVQALLNKLLCLDTVEKNSFYLTILTIIRKNSNDPNKLAGELIIEFNDILENKRIKLDAMLNGDSSSNSSKSAPGKPSPIFRRVS
jgi:hypothetical protein